MKRGRPPLRNLVREKIIEVMSSCTSPLTISSIRILVSGRLGRKVSWNTVKKYVKELVEEGVIKEIKLPHSKEEGKEGLSVYIIETR